MRDAVVFFSDGPRFPAAAFAATRAAALNDRADVDVIVFTNDRKIVDSAKRARWPFKVAPLVLRPGVELPPHFYRLFIPGLLGDSYRRLLYLDDDIYLEDRRPFALFDIDMAGHAIAAVRDIVIAFVPDRDELARTLRTAGTKYFNDGVMLIDCAAFNHFQIPRSLPRLISRITSGPSYLEQTVLNMVLDGNWLELSPAFNLFAYASGSFVGRAFPPAIIHFAGAEKPWRVATEHTKVAAEMAAFFGSSPWRNFFSLSALQPLRQPPHKRVVLERIGEPLRSYLRRTTFADVLAGITPAVVLEDSDSAHAERPVS